MPLRILTRARACDAALTCVRRTCPRPPWSRSRAPRGASRSSARHSAGRLCFSRAGGMMAAGGPASRRSATRRCSRRTGGWRGSLARWSRRRGTLTGAEPDHHAHRMTLPASFAGSLRIGRAHFNAMAACTHFRVLSRTGGIADQSRCHIPQRNEAIALKADVDSSSLAIKSSDVLVPLAGRPRRAASSCCARAACLPCRCSARGTMSIPPWR